MRRAALGLLVVLGTLGAMARTDVPIQPVASFALPRLPFLPGSIVPLDVYGLSAPYAIDLLGPGSLTDTTYSIPSDARGTSTLFASGYGGVAMRTLELAPAPDASQSFIAVASYDDGVVLHAPSPPFTERAVLGVGGAPSDVAIDPAGSIAAAATNGATAAIAALEPWHVRSYDNVPFADEVAFDSATHALFTSDRDSNGTGAITRILPDGSVRTRLLGITSEGIVVDAKRRRVYVANVNDGTISIVDADTLVELRRFKAVSRVFSLALSDDGKRLYATSNQSYSSPFAAAGSAIAIDLAKTVPRVVARSAPLMFPLGVALDEKHGRVIVTDERDNDFYVLDARTLRPLRSPVQTCRTPWKPLVDDGLLYVPCARADRVDVFSTSSLARIAGAPFVTGGYPLAVAVWHPAPRVKH